MSDDKPELRPIGVAGGEPLPEQGVPLRPLVPSDATTLQDLLADYVFYTPALLYLALPLVRDPFTDWRETVEETVVPLEFSADIALFSGLMRADQFGIQQWNNRVLAMPKRHWPAFHSFMLTVAFRGHGERKLARVRSREVQVLDVLWFRKQIIHQATWQTVPVTAFCLDTDKGCMIIANRRPWPTPPELVISPQSYPDTVALSEALSAEQARPYEAADAAKRKESE